MTKKGRRGWFGDHRRHVLAGKGVSTVLPDGRRLDVSKFVAGGEHVVSKKFEHFLRKGRLSIWDRGDDEFMDRYSVVIDDDLYSMSWNANAPNGVNMYYGDVTDKNLIALARDNVLVCSNIGQEDFDALPIGVIKGIEGRLEDYSMDKNKEE